MTDKVYPSPSGGLTVSSDCEIIGFGSLMNRDFIIESIKREILDTRRKMPDPKKQSSEIATENHMMAHAWERGFVYGLFKVANILTEEEANKIHDWIEEYYNDCNISE